MPKGTIMHALKLLLALFALLLFNTVVYLLFDRVVYPLADKLKKRP